MPVPVKEKTIKAVVMATAYPDDAVATPYPGDLNHNILPTEKYDGLENDAFEVSLSFIVIFQIISRSNIGS